MSLSDEINGALAGKTKLMKTSVYNWSKGSCGP